MLFSRASAQGPLQATCITPIAQGISSASQVGVVVWPVPATAQVHVSGVDEGARWELFDGLGRSVLGGVQRGGAGVLTIPSEGLAGGTYQLALHQRAGHSVHRVVVE
jgi:hypothetical protein